MSKDKKQILALLDEFESCQNVLEDELLMKKVEQVYDLVTDSIIDLQVLLELLEKNPNKRSIKDEFIERIEERLEEIREISEEYFPGVMKESSYTTLTKILENMRPILSALKNEKKQIQRNGYHSPRKKRKEAIAK